MTELQLFYDSGLFTYVVLPLLIFLARICDVTIGTLRIVMVAKGQKFWAPVMGFFEVLIWIVTMTKVVQNLDNWLCYIGYAGDSPPATWSDCSWKKNWPWESSKSRSSPGRMPLNLLKPSKSRATELHTTPPGRYRKRKHHPHHRKTGRNPTGRGYHPQLQSQSLLFYRRYQIRQPGNLPDKTDKPQMAHREIN